MNRQSARNTALTLLLALACQGASCVSGDGGTAGNDTYDGDRRRDDYDRPNRIPRYADVVHEGTGKQRWRADLDGAVYLYDRDNDVIRYTGPMRRGDELMVQPDDDRVSLNGRTVGTENLRRDGYHQIYFAATDRPPRDGDYNRRRDGTRGNDSRRPDRGDSVGASRAGDVPASAKKIDRGSGAMALARSTVDGTIYVYDEDSRAVVYRTPLRRGGAFRVVPREGLVYVDGQVVGRQKFAKGHTLTLYFDER